MANALSTSKLKFTRVIEYSYCLSDVPCSSTTSMPINTGNLFILIN